MMVKIQLTASPSLNNPPLITCKNRGTIYMTLLEQTKLPNDLL